MRIRSGLLFACLVATFPMRVTAEDAAPPSRPTVINFAFSRSLFAGVNENDAQAAVKVYARTLAEKNGLTAGPGALVFEEAHAMAEALRQNRVDLFSLTAEEFFALEDEGLGGPLLLTSSQGGFTEEYVLLVREQSAIRNVADLRGRSVNVASDLRSSLALVWLEVLCQEHGLGPARQAFARLTRASKPTQVVLPVFFGKEDACVLTRNGWDLMGELNPQVKRQLRVVAASPPVVPTITCFRRDFPERLKQRIVEVAEGSREEPSFQQLMSLFKTDQFCHQPLSALESTRALVATHRRIHGGTNSDVANAPGPAMPATTKQP